jgi:hypothetical protein
MTTYHLLTVLAMLVQLLAELSDGDLSKVARNIGREPTYRTDPKYCLLVFGPEAKTRIWLVQDGDTLYVDRNGNGDLTEDGERIVAERFDGANDGVYFFNAGEISDDQLLHKALSVSIAKLDGVAAEDELARDFLEKNPAGRGYSVSVELEMSGWNGMGVGGRVRERAYFVDVNGVLQFAERPQDAPIIHFGGAWQVSLFGRHTVKVGRDTDVVLGVGTPGLGAGTTAWIDYEGVIPIDAYPTLDITYPPKEPHGPPIRQRYELMRRC